MFDFHEGISNHFSMRIPGREDLFLINAFGLHFPEITASGLATVDGQASLELMTQASPDACVGGMSQRSSLVR